MHQIGCSLLVLIRASLHYVTANHIYVAIPWPAQTRCIVGINVSPILRAYGNWVYNDNKRNILNWHFTARRYAVHTQVSYQKAKGSKLVYWCQRSRRNSNEVTQRGPRAAKCRWGRSKSSTFDKQPDILSTPCPEKMEPIMF